MHIPERRQTTHFMTSNVYLKRTCIFTEIKTTSEIIIKSCLAFLLYHLYILFATVIFRLILTKIVYIKPKIYHIFVTYILLQYTNIYAMINVYQISTLSEET